MRPLGVELLGVRSDAEGPCPASLRASLLARKAAGLPAPKLFYAVPTSSNPTGVSWSEARKTAVYALACEFDFLILEDDAYFYLQFARPGAPPPGMAGLGRSLLSRDVQGRVIRADTFAKFLAPVRTLLAQVYRHRNSPLHPLSRAAGAAPGVAHRAAGGDGAHAALHAGVGAGRVFARASARRAPALRLGRRRPERPRRGVAA